MMSYWRDQLGKVRQELRVANRNLPAVVPYLPAILGCAAFIGLAFGGWHTHKALRDKDQIEISCEDFLNTPTDHRWVKLTNCEYDLEHTAVMTRSGSVEKVYLPLAPVGLTSEKARILVVRDDDETVDVFEAVQHGNDPSDAALARMKAKLQAPVEGMIGTALDFSDADRSKLEWANLDRGLEKDYVMIEADAKPHLIGGILILIGSLVVGITALVLLVKQRRAKRPPKPAPLPKAIVRE